MHLKQTWQSDMTKCAWNEFRQENSVKLCILGLQKKKQTKRKHRLPNDFILIRCNNNSAAEKMPWKLEKRKRRNLCDISKIYRATRYATTDIYLCQRWILKKNYFHGELKIEICFATSQVCPTIRINKNDIEKTNMMKIIAKLLLAKSKCKWNMDWIRNGGFLFLFFCDNDCICERNWNLEMPY